MWIRSLSLYQNDYSSLGDGTFDLYRHFSFHYAYKIWSCRPLCGIFLIFVWDFFNLCHLLFQIWEEKDPHLFIKYKEKKIKGEKRIKLKHSGEKLIWHKMLNLWTIHYNFHKTKSVLILITFKLIISV